MRVSWLVTYEAGSHRYCFTYGRFVEHYFKGSAAAADPLEGEVPLVVDMTLRGVDMTLRGKILGGQNSSSWGFSGPGTLKIRFPVKNDVE